MLLAVNNLDVRFTTEDGIVQAVNGLNFSLDDLVAIHGILQHVCGAGTHWARTFGSSTL